MSGSDEFKDSIDFGGSTGNILVSDKEPGPEAGERQDLPGRRRKMPDDRGPVIGLHVARFAPDDKGRRPGEPVRRLQRVPGQFGERLGQDRQVDGPPPMNMISYFLSCVMVDFLLLFSI